MHNNNKKFTYILSTFLNWLCPLFLIITIFIVYAIYFEPVTLCDDNGYFLHGLKTRLTTEVADYRIAVINHDRYTELRELLSSISDPKFRDFAQERVLDSQIQVTEVQIRETEHRIHLLENNIRIFDPSFKSRLKCSTVDYINAFRAARG